MSTIDEDAAVEEQEEPVEAPEEGAPEGPSEPDAWTQVFGDEDEDLREKYGSDPAALAQAYRETSAKSTKMAQELAEYRQYAAEREAYDAELEQTGVAPPQQGGPQPGFDYAALVRQAGSLFDETGEISPDKLAGILSVHGAVQTQLIAQAVQEALEQRFAGFEKEKVAPLASRLERDAQAAEIANLEDVYGDRFEAVTKEAQRMRDDYPDVSVRGLYGMAAAQLDQRAAQRRRLEAEGYTLDSRGRPSAPKPRLSPEELELAAMEEIGRSKRSMI